MHPTFTGDREFILISTKFSLRVGDVISFEEPNRAYKAWDQKHPKPDILTKRIAGFEGYCGYMKAPGEGHLVRRSSYPEGTFGPWEITC